jgi:purine-binding chemotaxis protein CheW
MQLLAFRLAGETYALRLDGVERVVRAVEVTPFPEAPPDVLGVINLFGRILPVLDLRRRKGLPPREIDVSDFFLIVHLPARVFALWVDEVIGVIDYPEAEIVRATDVLAGARGVEAMVKTAQGIAFIANPEALWTPLVASVRSG